MDESVAQRVGEWILEHRPPVIDIKLHRGT